MNVLFECLLYKISKSKDIFSILAPGDKQYSVNKTIVNTKYGIIHILVRGKYKCNSIAFKKILSEETFILIL